MQRVPAPIGDPLAAVETPALVVDLDAFEHNLDLMANAVRGSGLALRPHAKSHKCPS
jgi:D-serine deaminase-like pyridoxal phosphate-dependent protein